MHKMLTKFGPGARDCELRQPSPHLGVGRGVTAGGHAGMGEVDDGHGRALAAADGTP